VQDRVLLFVRESNALLVPADVSQNPVDKEAGTPPEVRAGGPPGSPPQTQAPIHEEYLIRAMRRILSTAGETFLMECVKPLHYPVQPEAPPQYPEQMADKALSLVSNGPESEKVHPGCRPPKALSASRVNTFRQVSGVSGFINQKSKHPFQRGPGPHPYRSTGHGSPIQDSITG